MVACCEAWEPKWTQREGLGRGQSQAQSQLYFKHHNITLSATRTARDIKELCSVNMDAMIKIKFKNKIVACDVLEKTQSQHHNKDNNYHDDINNKKIILYDCITPNSK